MLEQFMTKPENEKVAVIRIATTENKKVLFNASTQTGAKVSDYIGTVIDVMAIVVTNALVNEDYNDPNSVKVNKPVVHFFTTDGLHISSMGGGIVRMVDSMFEMDMLPTNDEPLALKIIEKNTKRGKTYTFELEN